MPPAAAGSPTRSSPSCQSCWAGACRAGSPRRTPPRACRISGARRRWAWRTRPGARPRSTLSSRGSYELKAGGSGLRKAVALAYYGGLRKEDVVRVPKVARANGSIDLDMINKNGKELSIFEAKRLTAILNEADEIQMGRAAQRNGRKVGDRLVLNRLGQPYTKNGLDSSFDRIERQLVKDGKILPGLTFHGLRKSLGKAAADAGFSENDIDRTFGQANPASARVYTQEAARNQGTLRVFKALT